MTDKDIELKLKAAIERTAPDGLGRLLSAIDNGKGDIIMEKTAVPKKRNRWIGLVAALLAVALIGGASGVYYRQNYAVATTVSLDVNPSIQLEVNRSEKVLTCAGLNDEGREILASMNGGADLKGSKLNVAVNAIVGAIVRAGYLDSLSSAILISVEDNDAARGERLQAQLVAEVDEVLQTAANSAGVLSQYLTVDAGLNQQAQQNNISSGKAALVNQVLALNANLDFEKLAALSVEELRDLIKIGAPAIPIGKDAAVQAALAYAASLGGDDLNTQVDPELDDPMPHYEVELISHHASMGDAEVIVDAFTGEILATDPADLTVWTGLTHHQTGTSSTTTGPGVTADEAFNAAAEYFNTQHPELNGNFLNIKTKYDWDDGHYDVEFWCVGCEFDYDVDGQTGDILKEETDYRCTPPTVPDTTQDTTPKDTTPKDTTPKDTTPTQPADIGADAAKAAGLARAGITDAGFVTWIKCQREYDDGRLEYDLEFECGSTVHECEILAADGTVLSYEHEPCDNALHHHDEEHHDEEHHDDDHHTGTTGDIGADAAKAAALRHAGLAESQVTRLKCERDRDDGRLVYEIEFKSNGWEYEYKIDAASGSVLEHERDWDD